MVQALIGKGCRVENGPSIKESSWRVVEVECSSLGLLLSRLFLVVVVSWVLLLLLGLAPPRRKKACLWLLLLLLLLPLLMTQLASIRGYRTGLLWTVVWWNLVLVAAPSKSGSSPATNLGWWLVHCAGYHSYSERTYCSAPYNGFAQSSCLASNHSCSSVFILLLFFVRIVPVAVLVVFGTTSATVVVTVFVVRPFFSCAHHRFRDEYRCSWMTNDDGPTTRSSSSSSSSWSFWMAVFMVDLLSEWRSLHLLLSLLVVFHGRLCVVLGPRLGGLLVAFVKRRLAAPPLPCRRPTHANRHRLLYFLAGLVGKAKVSARTLQTPNTKPKTLV